MKFFLKKKLEYSILKTIPIKRIQHNMELCRKLLKTFEEYQPKPSDTEIIEAKLGSTETICEKAISTLKMVYFFKYFYFH